MIRGFFEYSIEIFILTINFDLNNKMIDMKTSVKLIMIALLSVMGSNSFAQSSLNGSWEGKLMINPEMGLRLVINVIDSEGTQPKVTMDSPDQGAYGIPMQIEYLSADSLNVAVPQLTLVYKGRLQGDSISGHFSQGPINLPLVLKSKKTSLQRPQTPVAPFPYITEEVIFQSALDDAPLYGTLCMPDLNKKETPVVLLVSGSGTQNRDEEIFEHKPFAVIADYLARNGIASLRYDDRGFDPSLGYTPNPTTYENSMDAMGGLRYLKDIGFSKVGILGHSEGGLIADKVASEGNLLNFIIEIGGPAVPGDSILLFQNDFLLKDGKLPDQYISMYLEAMKGLFESQKDINPQPFDESRYKIFSEEFQNNPVVAPLAKNLKENFISLAPWIRYFINYDPIQDIRNISVPTFFIYGSKDFQVPPSLNVPVLKKEFPQALIKVYPDLNHMMQHCETGKLTEYGQIEETISPEVLNDIKNFILSIK